MRASLGPTAFCQRGAEQQDLRGRDISAAAAGRPALIADVRKLRGLYPNGRWSGWHVVLGGGSAPATR